MHTRLLNVPGKHFLSRSKVIWSVEPRVSCLGVQAASPLAAVFQFFVRDLAGMLGGVLFAFAQARVPLTDHPLKSDSEDARGPRLTPVSAHQGLKGQDHPNWFIHLKFS